MFNMALADTFKDKAAITRKSLVESELNSQDFKEFAAKEIIDALEGDKSFVTLFWPPVSFKGYEKEVQETVRGMTQKFPDIKKISVYNGNIVVFLKDMTPLVWLGAHLDALPSPTAPGWK